MRVQGVKHVATENTFIQIYFYKYFVQSIERWWILDIY